MSFARTRTCALGAALALTLSATAAAGPASPPGAPTIALDPRQLDRGASARVAYLADGVIVDGSTRVRLNTTAAGLLGTAGSDYLVWASIGSSPVNVVRVSPDGDTTLLARGGEGYHAVPSADGDEIAVPTLQVSDTSTVIALRDTSDGDVLRRTKVRGFAEVLDVGADQVLLGTTSPARTLLWDTARGTTTVLARRTGYAASLAEDRLALFTKDPFQGGCSRISLLSDPQKTLSQSCSERVQAFSPDGTRIATVALLSDGLGPRRISLRTTRGRLLARFDAPYFFSDVIWESARGLLLQTHGRHRSVLIRCVATSCERASRFGPGAEVRRRLPAFALSRSLENSGPENRGP